MKIDSRFLLAGAFLLFGHITFAQSACPDRDQNTLRILEEQNPQAYEQYRKCKVQNAKDENEFLQWATPDEIASATGMDTAYGMTSEMSYSADKLVDIHVWLGNHVMEMISPSETLTGAALGTDWRRGYHVPTGCFTEHIWTDRYHRSNIFPRPTGGAPMSNAVFFSGGSALHYGSLRIPSHGCIHLDWATSVEVIDTVIRYGTNNTRICVQ